MNSQLGSDMFFTYENIVKYFGLWYVIVAIPGHFNLFTIECK